jgi:hypothetical protein
LVDVYVVLRTPAVEEGDLKSYLSRLSLSLECHAVGQQLVKPSDASQPAQARETKELLVSDTISVTDDPLICATEIQSEEETESIQYIYIFWKAIVPIGP